VRAAFSVLVSLTAAAQVGTAPLSTLCSGELPVQARDDYRYDTCEMLKPMNESVAPMRVEANAVEAYRLFYLRSFHPPIVLRLEIHSDSEATLSGKQLFTHTDRVQYARTAYLTASQIADFRTLIAKEDFWTAPSEFHVMMGFGPFSSPIPKGDAVIMSDGAEWIVEGIDAKRYHVMGDDGGAFAGPVREIGLAMIALAKKKLPMLSVEPVY